MPPSCLLRLPLLVLVLLLCAAERSLCRAAQNGDVAEAKRLVELEVDVNYQDQVR